MSNAPTHQVYCYLTLTAGRDCCRCNKYCKNWWIFTKSINNLFVQTSRKENIINPVTDKTFIWSNTVTAMRV